MKIFKEGDIFIVPLEGNKQVYGVVARKQNDINSILAYLYKCELKFWNNDLEYNFAGETPIAILRIGWTYLRNGRWKVVGNIPEFSREKFPVPLMYSDLRGVMIRYTQDDIADPGQIVLYNSPSPDEEIALAGLYGAKAAEILLARRLT